eukprot:s619_g34.t1
MTTSGAQEWMRKASADQQLQAMFRRFAQALDQHSTPSQGSIVLRGAFQSVLALVWARQQLSVVLGRLRGYFQPWFLGCWPQSKWPLLSPEDPYFMQAEIRLRVMMSQLDAVDRPKDFAPRWYKEQAPSLYKLMQDSDALRQPNSRRISWQALADLLVVHHPGWPSQVPSFQPVEPVAKGVTPLAPHFGRLEQRAWSGDSSGDTAGGPVTWCYDSGSESAVSFGTPAFGSGDQARKGKGDGSRNVPGRMSVPWNKPCGTGVGAPGWDEPSLSEFHRQFQMRGSKHRDTAWSSASTFEPADSDSGSSESGAYLGIPPPPGLERVPMTPLAPAPPLAPAAAPAPTDANPLIEGLRQTVWQMAEGMSQQRPWFPSPKSPALPVRPVVEAADELQPVSS